MGLLTKDYGNAWLMVVMYGYGAEPEDKKAEQSGKRSARTDVGDWDATVMEGN